MQPTKADILAELERLKASLTFKKSDKGLQILGYLVNKRIEDAPVEAFKEMSIGLTVYGDKYDPLPASKVRAAMGRIRVSLQNYYQTEGKGNPVRIEIGSDYYVPEFRYTVPLAPREPPLVAPEPDTPIAPSSQPDAPAIDVVSPNLTVAAPVKLITVGDLFPGFTCPFC